MKLAAAVERRVIAFSLAELNRGEQALVAVIARHDEVLKQLDDVAHGNFNRGINPDAGAPAPEAVSDFAAVLKQLANDVEPAIMHFENVSLVNGLPADSVITVAAHEGARRARAGATLIDEAIQFGSANEYTYRSSLDSFRGVRQLVTNAQSSQFAEDLQRALPPARLPEISI